MTRINLIPIEDLTDKHLLAEHREIVRIPNLIKKWWRVNKSDIPEKYTLWTGHVKFFYNKLNFIFWRYLQLYKECKKRWFKVQYYGTSFDLGLLLELELMWNYNPTEEAIKINKERIAERLNKLPK